MPPRNYESMEFLDQKIGHNRRSTRSTFLLKFISWVAISIYQSNKWSNYCCKQIKLETIQEIEESKLCSNAFFHGSCKERFYKEEVGNVE